MDPNSNQNNNISNEDYINYVLEETKAQEPEKAPKQIKKISIKIPLIITAIIAAYCAFLIIKDFHYIVSDTFASGFAYIFAAIGILIAGGIIHLTWIIYLIILTIQKKKLKEKNWTIPLTILIILIIGPNLLWTTISLATNGNIEKYTKATPDIVSYEKISDIPMLDGYKVLGDDINEYDVYDNIETYKDTKVLVKGIPSLENYTSSVKGKEKIEFFNKEDGDKILYRFLFIDKNSEFSKDRRIFFATENTLPEDYYIYVYGIIKSTQYNNDGGYYDYKIINIEPEKIYYTLREER